MWAMEAYRLYLVLVGLLQYGLMLVGGLLLEGWSWLWLWLCSAQSKPWWSRRKLGLPPLIHRGLKQLYSRWIYQWAACITQRSLCSAPSTRIQLLDPQDSGQLLRAVLNSASYNYLGFSDRTPRVQAAVKAALERYSTSTCSSSMECGRLELHVQLEASLVRFLGRDPQADDALLYGMGFDTNSSGLSALCEPGDLILSDAMNHASIIQGCRRSGARIMPFAHNDAQDAERRLRAALCAPLPPRRVFLVVEGVYSMEGHMTPLPDFVALRAKYGAFLYVDEAHSIGAVGLSGRGVCEHYGLSPFCVDLLMGTFSKSFGAAGGYIVASRPLVQQLRLACCDGCSMSAGVAAQILAVLKIMLGEEWPGEAERRTAQLARNTAYLRTGLLQAGFSILGQEGSPVVPLLTYTPLRSIQFSRRALQLGLLVVMAAYPATSPFGMRIRFCVSAGHSDAEMEELLAIVRRIGCEFGMISVYGKNGLAVFLETPLRLLRQVWSLPSVFFVRPP